jgi:hypothetical protein
MKVFERKMEDYRWLEQALIYKGFLNLAKEVLQLERLIWL